MATNPERIGSASFLGLSVAYVLVAVRLPNQSPNLSDVGPRLYPLVLGVLFVFLSILWTVSAFKGTAADPDIDAEATTSHKTTPSVRRVGTLILAGALFLALLPLIGFTIATMLFLFSSILIVSWIRPTRRSLLFSLAVAVVGALALEWLLTDVMSIYLP